jgi:hypothetical protein
MWYKRLLNLDQEIKRLFPREQNWGMREEERMESRGPRSRDGYVLGRDVKK